MRNYLFTRGIWLVFAELFIIGFGRTFNLAFHFFNLQIIWAIGISMIVLSFMIYMQRRFIMIAGVLLIAGHNLLDGIHLPGSFTWSFLHNPENFVLRHFTISVHYPVLPWIGLIAIGYCFGNLYAKEFNAKRRREILLATGFVLVTVFIILRSLNLYGDASHWLVRENVSLSFMSFLNLTKYPPSLLYILMTIGPALLFLGFTEKPLNVISQRIAVFGRVPFFYYVIHIYLIHVLALAGSVFIGYNVSDMILTGMVNSQAGLRGYGFSLPAVYIVWVGLVVILYPFSSWFDSYKRRNITKKRWLSYL